MAKPTTPKPAGVHPTRLTILPMRGSPSKRLKKLQVGRKTWRAIAAQRARYAVRLHDRGFKTIVEFGIESPTLKPTIVQLIRRWRPTPSIFRSGVGSSPGAEQQKIGLPTASRGARFSESTSGRAKSSFWLCDRTTTRTPMRSVIGSWCSNSSGEFAALRAGLAKGRRREHDAPRTHHRRPGEMQPAQARR